MNHVLQTVLTGLVGYKNIKPQKDMKLGGGQRVCWGRDGEEAGRRGMRDGYDQNALHTCMKFLKRKNGE